MFTSTTAPGLVFESRAALAEHYRTDWHKYNLKRRQAGLPFLLRADFEARLAAAQALRAEKERAAQAAGRAHLKDKSKKKNKNKKNQSVQEIANGGAVKVISQCTAYDGIKQQEKKDQSNDQASSSVEAPALDKQEDGVSAEEECDVEMKQPEDDDDDDDENNKEEIINPCQSLFDRHVSNSVEENIAYMQEKYGFFIPDSEYLTDAEGLIGYCHEKITLGRLCLYCHSCYPKKSTSTTLAIQSHMRDAQHCKLKYESGIDLEDLQVFYDFSDTNQEFLLGSRQQGGRLAAAAAAAAADNAMQEDDDDEEEEEDGWEDMADDEEEEEDGRDDNVNVEDVDDDDDDDDDYYYNDLQEEVQRMGWNVTALGELVFPDGRIIGHRALNRYYKQRSSYRRPQKASVMAAQQASRERLYEGRVVQLPGGAQRGATSSSAMVSASTTRQAKMAGVPTSLAMGRGGKGILVPSAGTGAFTQVSLYRFRAVLRKQKRDEQQARKLKNRTAQNMNRMDKKANRLMNDQSVQHAKR